MIQEFKKLAGNPFTDENKKCFFIITHSPYLIDIRNLEDFKNILIFHQTQPPTYINQFTTDDEHRLSISLPKLNTHHKQFFFSSNPIFVEGYTDQQLFSLIYEKMDFFIGAAGSSIIDVGGKEQLDIFFRICNSLNINGHIICDLDVILDGKLRQSLSTDRRCIDYFKEQGLGNNIMKYIGNLENIVSSEIDKLIKFDEDNV